MRALAVLAAVLIAAAAVPTLLLAQDAPLPPAKGDAPEAPTWQPTPEALQQRLLRLQQELQQLRQQLRSGGMGPGGRSPMAGRMRRRDRMGGHPFGGQGGQPGGMGGQPGGMAGGGQARRVLMYLRSIDERLKRLETKVFGKAEEGPGLGAFGRGGMRERRGFGNRFLPPKPPAGTGASPAPRRPGAPDDALPPPPRGKDPFLGEETGGDDLDD